MPNSLIRILPPHEAQKIAAGEVVERPAHVVKELLENSLDAGATSISLYLEKSGKKLIRIVDNGSGMSREDAKLCIQPHATSKLHSFDELETIHSFGFRGEALASISAISIIDLITKTDDNHALHLTFKAGELISEQASQGQRGTDIRIHDLFFNTPVRKKFLKHDETEWNQIKQIVYALSLAHLTIHIKLFRDNALTLNAPPAQTLKERVIQLWNYSLADNLLSIKTDDIHGLISNHHLWRYGKQQIFFFVNNRYIKNPELTKGLMSGFQGILPPQKYPVAFLFLSLDPKTLDINVHPKKEEIRFSHPGTIRTKIQKVVKESLEHVLNTTFAQKENVVEKKEQALTTIFYNHQALYPENNQKNVHTISDFTPQPFHQATPLQPQQVFNQDLPQKKHSAFTQSLQNQKREKENIVPKHTFSGTLKGQLFKTYILIEKDENIIIIDQHAAHERILYEQMKSNFENREGIQLIFPHVVTLKETEILAIMEHQQAFSQHGIEFVQFGDTEISISSSPPRVQGVSLDEIIREAAHCIEEHEDLDKEKLRKKLHEHMHSHLACKSAVRAGDELSDQEMHSIVTHLLNVENRHMCIHGRPTMWTLGKEELEKKFRRR